MYPARVALKVHGHQTGPEMNCFRHLEVTDSHFAYGHQFQRCHGYTELFIVTAYFFAGIIRVDRIGRFETGENRNGAGNLTAAPEKIRKGICIKNVPMNQMVAVDETSAVFSHKNKLVHAAFKLHGKGWVWPPAGNDKKEFRVCEFDRVYQKNHGASGPDCSAECRPCQWQSCAPD